MIKYLLVIGVIAFVYFFFIKKRPAAEQTDTKRKDPQETSEMIECSECGLYVELSEAILSSSKYYCSNECINKEA